MQRKGCGFEAIIYLLVHIFLVHMMWILYSLKFSRSKIFMDFGGRSMATKIFSHEISCSQRIQCMASSLTMKICFCLFFLSKIILAKTQNIYPLKILGYNIIINVTQLLTSFIGRTAMSRGYGGLLLLLFHTCT